MIVEYDVRFTKSSNFKEEEKSTDKIQYESLPTSFLAKPSKIPTSSTILTLLPPIEAIHKPVHEET